MIAAFVCAVAASGASAAVSYNGYTYYTTADFCTLTVTPKAATNQVGSLQTVTATVTDAVPQGVQTEGNPCFHGKEPILFTIVSGPNAGKVVEGGLNGYGQASFTYTSAATGTDVIKAELTITDQCYRVPNEVDLEAVTPLPAACEGYLPIQPSSLLQCGGEVQVEALGECPKVTFSDTGQVTWSAPVVGLADPSMSIARFKRCVSGKFTIAPSYSGGTITSSTLFVDGKKKQTHTNSDPFHLSARSYKTGKHNFEVVTNFSNGKAASKFGSFSRCAAHTTVKRVTPKFTG